MKGLTQKALSLLPWGEEINTLLQTRFGGLKYVENEAEGKFADWTLTMEYLSDAGVKTEGAQIVEIGTGWYPAIPIFFVLAGARSVLTYDIARHLDENATLQFLEGLRERVPAIARAAGLSTELVGQRVARLQQSNSVAEVLANANINYFAPADARFTGLGPDSVDIIYSNSVLEHIPKDAICQLMVESFQILKHGGVAVHNVACNDHYANFDKSISYVNFLRFSNKQWRLWNNSIQFQNRLRAPEFLCMARDAGFQIVVQRTHVRPGTLEALRGMSVAPDFAAFSEADLAATTMDFVAQKV